MYLILVLLFNARDFTSVTHFRLSKYIFWYVCRWRALTASCSFRQLSTYISSISLVLSGRLHRTKTCTSLVQSFSVTCNLSTLRQSISVTMMTFFALQSEARDLHRAIGHDLNFSRWNTSRSIAALMSSCTQASWSNFNQERWSTEALYRWTTVI